MKTLFSLLLSGLLLIPGASRVFGSSQLLPQFPGTDGSVFAIVIDEARDRIYLAGRFSEVGGVARSHLAALSLSSGLLLPWNPGANSAVYAMTLDPVSGVVFLGGEFTIAGGLQRIRLAAVDPAGVPVPDWNPIPDSDVRSLAYRGNVLYLGGYFTHLGLSPVKGLVSLDATTAALRGGFLPEPDPTPVSTIFATDTAIYAGGNFTTAGAAAHAKMVALNPTNGAALAGFTANVTAGSEVQKIVASGTNLYLAGGFTQINGTARGFLASVNESTGVVQAWNPNASGSCRALAMVGSKLYVGGVFNSISGVPRSRLAALDPLAAAATATSWAPAITGGQVGALAVFGSTVFIGGEFTTVEGSPRMGFAALNDSDLGPPLAPVKATIQAKGKLKITTRKSRVKLSGTSSEAFLVEAKVAKLAYQPARGTVANWAVSVRLKAPRTIVLVQARGIWGDSSPLKFKIRRKQ